MMDRLLLPTRLSQVLVAFTIEFDNESERRMPHRTTNDGAAHGTISGSLHAPWLVSMVMWSNCMQHIREEGITVAELARLARTPTNLNGMERWGYIAIEPKPRKSDRVIRFTAAGRKAQEIRRPLFGVIEQRWEERFGRDEIDRLRELLTNVVTRIDLDLPDCLPILGYGLFSRGPDRKRTAPVGELALAALLSRALLAYAMEFERESDLSLAICADVLRVLDEKGVRLRDLPRQSGVSKEAISMALGILGKKHLAVVGPDPAGSRAKIVRLTPPGVEAQDAYRQLLASIEERWQERFGVETIRALRDVLGRLIPVLEKLQPYPDGWRASVPRPDTLPHYPMVLHRGGFPDGS
jgi:DNA-binding MarR family transcriptional regulator